MATMQYEYVNGPGAPQSSASAQQNMMQKDGPALDTSHEHQHACLHHDDHGERDCKEQVVYSGGTTTEKSALPNPDLEGDGRAKRHYKDPVNMHLGGLDTEKGSTNPRQFAEEDPQKLTLSSFYARYRLIFHALIWLFFTGCVLKSFQS